RLSSAPQYPPDSDSPKPPVSGDLAPTLWRPAPGTGAPVRTPRALTRIFPGPKGSAPLAAYFPSYCAVTPPPPADRTQQTAPASCITVRRSHTFTGSIFFQ